MRPAGPARGERGAAAILIVAASSVLLLFLGMAVDYGVWLRFRRAMQNACDAGALAGALNLRRDPASASPTAERYAANNMTQDNITWDSLQATTLDDNNQPTLIAPSRVRVEIHEDVFTVFFRLVGRNTVHVAVDCYARLTPVILSRGLVPIGLNYSDWIGYYNSDCWQYVTQNVDLALRPAHCQTFEITMDISDKDNPWGSGNTGLLSMSCFDCPRGGGAQWLEYFINGAPTPYCYDMAEPPTPDVTSGTYPAGSPANCANVKTEPGVKIGPISRGVQERCASGDVLDQIIQMPLLNPAYMESGQGTYTTEIWGFTAWQIDCDRTRFTGADSTIYGGFVSIISMQAYGTETDFDTGVYTVKLIE